MMGPPLVLFLLLLGIVVVQSRHHPHPFEQNVDAPPARNVWEVVLLLGNHRRIKELFDNRKCGNHFLRAISETCENGFRETDLETAFTLIENCCQNSCPQHIIKEVVCF
ncbi:hypothetical protein L596_010532 [Steinernema carpocapsae]|uniref:INSulin related n=1 Tax=Steinernema carpocapsae TaxID=34508 RepID=A0A4U5PIR9_STECR|nr:hypothetical protein L596_010532 [Steinernema carpocapsae]